MSQTEIEEVIKYPNEERYLEFKGPVSWNGEIKVKITKSIMALANLRDGGWIVIGKEEQSDRSFRLIGLSQQESDTYDSDEIKAFVYARAEPPVSFDVVKTDFEKKRFVLIKVSEFAEVPIICKKSDGNILHCGQVYVRSKGKPESIPIPSDAEMREIIEIAVDKGVRNFVKRLQRTGIWAPREQAQTADDEAAYRNQRAGIP